MSSSLFKRHNRQEAAPSNGHLAEEDRTPPPTRFDEALQQHRAQTSKIREAIGTLRDHDRDGATPIEVPTLMLIDRIRRVLEKHGCGNCDDCRSLERLLRDQRR